jgi:hypothetical protein
MTVLFFSPTSQGVDCAVDNFDEFTQGYLKTMIRIACPYFVVLYLYFEWHGVHSLFNVTVLAVANSLVMLGTAMTTMAQDDQNRISGDCFDYLANSFLTNLVWSWFVVLLVIMDKFQARRSGTSTETQPLTYQPLT